MKRILVVVFLTLFLISCQEQGQQVRKIVVDDLPKALGQQARLCFIVLDGDEKYYFDEGEIFAGETFLGSTKNGCAMVSQDVCVGNSRVTFYPESTRIFNYTMTTNEVINTCEDAQIAIPDQGFEEFSRLKWAIPYIQNVLTDDPRYANLGKEIAYGCLDASCKINHVYRHVVETLSYIPDPKIGDEDTIIPPDDTIRRGGGDCEDLTGVMNTYLENLGVDTMIVLTENHAYSLACDANHGKLQNYVKDSFFQEVESSHFQEVTLEPGQVFFYGGVSNLPQDTVKFQYTVDASTPIDAHVVPTSQDYQNYVNRNAYNQYPDCEKKNAWRTTQNCVIDSSGGILLANTAKSTSYIQLNVSYFYEHYIVDMDEVKLNFYDINDKTCVVLDATAGKYGYPGYSVADYTVQIAVDPESYEWWYLE